MVRNLSIKRTVSNILATDFYKVLIILSISSQRLQHKLIDVYVWQ